MLALSGTLAGEARRGSLEFVATTPLGMRRIAVEKLFAHLTGMAIVVVVLALVGVVTGAGLQHAARRRDLRPGGRRVRAVARRRRPRLGLGRVRRSPRSSVAAASAAIAGAVLLGGYFVNGYQGAVPAFAPLANLTWWGWTAHFQPLTGQADWLSLVPGALVAIVLFVVGDRGCSRGATSA